MTLLTEDEAKGKWCPFSRKAVTIDNSTGFSVALASANRNTRDDGPSVTCCIGSACMAWRWGQKRNPDWKSSDYQMMAGWPVAHPDDKPATHITDTEHGFCGLAGRPS